MIIGLEESGREKQWNPERGTVSPFCPGHVPTFTTVLECRSSRTGFENRVSKHKPADVRLL